MEKDSKSNEASSHQDDEQDSYANCLSTVENLAICKQISKEHLKILFDLKVYSEKEKQWQEELAELRAQLHQRQMELESLDNVLREKMEQRRDLTEMQCGLTELMKTEEGNCVNLINKFKLAGNDLTEYKKTKEKVIRVQKELTSSSEKYRLECQRFCDQHQQFLEAVKTHSHNIQNAESVKVSLTNQKTELESELSELNAENRVLDSVLEKAKTENHAVKKRLESIKTEEATLEKSPLISPYAQKTLEKANMLEQTHLKEIEASRMKLSELMVENTKIQEDSAKLKEEFGKAMQRENDLKEKIAEAEEQLCNVRQKDKSPIMLHLEENVRELIEIRDSLLSQNYQLEKQMAEMSEANEILQQKLNAIESENQKVTNDLNELNKQLLEKEDLKTDFEEKIKQKREEIEILKELTDQKRKQLEDNMEKNKKEIQVLDDFENNLPERNYWKVLCDCEEELIEKNDNNLKILEQLTRDKRYIQDEINEKEIELVLEKNKIQTHSASLANLQKQMQFEPYEDINQLKIQLEQEVMRVSELKLKLRKEELEYEEVQRELLQIETDNENKKKKFEEFSSEELALEEKIKDLMGNEDVKKAKFYDEKLEDLRKRHEVKKRELEDLMTASEDKSHLTMLRETTSWEETLMQLKEQLAAQGKPVSKIKPLFQGEDQSLYSDDSIQTVAAISKTAGTSRKRQCNVPTEGAKRRSKGSAASRKYQRSPTSDFL